MTVNNYLKEPCCRFCASLFKERDLQKRVCWGKSNVVFEEREKRKGTFFKCLVVLALER